MMVQEHIRRDHRRRQSPWAIDLEDVRIELGSALELIHHDRWTFGGLRDGRLRVLAESRNDGRLSNPRYRELSPLARRALYERSPLAFSSLVGPPPQFGGDIWDEKAAAVLYAPVGIPNNRPVGILMVGCGQPTWYDDEDVAYVAQLAGALTVCVLTFCGPLARLTVGERRLVQLLAEGLADQEIAAALGMAPEEASGAVAAVIRKLSLRSRRAVHQLLPEGVVSGGAYLL